MTIPLITALAAGITAIAASVAAVRVRGSTAVPAALWAIAACLALAGDSSGEATGFWGSTADRACARLVVAALAVCPAMSLLGAKRPQHGVWQLIVAALAVVVALPAPAAWLVRPGSLPDVHPLGRGFLLVLIVVGWLNFVGTSHGLAATAIAAGQLAIVLPFLPGSAAESALQQPACDLAGGLLMAAGSLGTLVHRSRSGRHGPAGSGPAARAGTSVADLINPPFRALRDTLGAAWALRIAERFDAVATERGWPCRLHFAGLDVGGDPADASWHRDALRAFRALARRFVDDAWLVRHGWREASA